MVIRHTGMRGEAASAQWPGFSDPCSCGRFGHVDALATPARIRGMLGGANLEQLGEIGPRDPGFGRAHDVFARIGAALGRPLAHVSRTVNPSRIVAYLPGVLADPKPDTVASAYISAVRQEVGRALAADDEDGYLTVRAFPTEPGDAELLGASAAAVCVLESFIEHALRLDAARRYWRRPARTSAASGHSLI